MYVDDIVVTGNNPNVISRLKSHLHHAFSIKDLSPLSFFLGLELTYSQSGIIVTQQKFSKELLRDSSIAALKPHVRLLPLNHKLSPHDSPILANPTLYRSLVAKLNFLTHTRLDISYSVQALGQHMQKPTIHYFEALTHTLGFKSTTLGQGILLLGRSPIS